MLARCFLRRFAGAQRPLLMSRSFTAAVDPMLNQSLEQVDNELFQIIESEKKRSRDSLVLIPSENYTSRAVLDSLGSIMQNKYSEGYPGARYYGGNEFIDMAESLCQKRALEAFHLDPALWGVNVQPLSGSPANFEAYSAVLQPHDRIMALDLPHGGHLSHGYQIPGKKISSVSVFFETVPYRLDESTGLIDYDMMEKVAAVYRPKLLVGGASAYSRHVDYARMRQIADQHNSYLLSDMAHISGLVAAGVSPSPFDHCDLVTTTTHKSLRGPRGAMIFFRKGVRGVDKKGKEIYYDLEQRVNSAVFPGAQGGPHNHTITALAAALKLAQTPAFVEYQTQVVKNAATLATALTAKGYSLISGGTDNHLMLVDVRSTKGLTGSKVEKVAELVGIALNKNTVPGDRSAMNPGGIRIGTPALTTRGLVEKDFETVADFLDRAVTIAVNLQERAGSKKLVDFQKQLDAEPAEMLALKEEVTAFARSFATIGY